MLLYGEDTTRKTGASPVIAMSHDLGYIDLEQKTLQTIDNPFGTRLSPMSRGQSVTHVSGSDMARNGAA